MIVQELIDKLNRLNSALPIAIEWDGGWCNPDKISVEDSEDGSVLVIDCNEYGTFNETRRV